MAIDFRPVIEGTQLLSQRNQSLNLSDDALESSLCSLIVDPLQEGLRTPEDHIERGPHLLGQSGHLHAPQRKVTIIGFLFRGEQHPVPFLAIWFSHHDFLASIAQRINKSFSLSIALPR